MNKKIYEIYLRVEFLISKGSNKEKNLLKESIEMMMYEYQAGKISEHTAKEKMEDSLAIIKRLENQIKVSESSLQISIRT